MKILLISPLPKDNQNVAGGIAGWTNRFVNSDLVRMNNSINIVDTSLIGSRAKGETKYNYYSESVRTLKILFKTIILILFNKPDIVHLNSNCSMLGLVRDNAISFIVSIARIPVVVHMRCDVAFYSYTRYAYFSLKKMIGRASMVFSLNNSSSMFIQEKFGKASIYIPLFISDDFFLNTKTRNISEKVRRICFVGHISENKGCNIITNIAKILCDIDFFLVGQKFDSFNDKELSNNIYLLGNVTADEVNRILSEADLFLFPSKTEGFPNAVLEAMASGLPIVASAVGAIPDMIGTSQEGGILINSFIPEDYIDAIITLINDRNRRKEMSKWNIQTVLDKYTESKIITMMLEKYSECIERSYR
ncbi:glycosyltransferase family 4 protein [Sphaerochaeta globosa]|uniref:Glycosyl transferase group 1 n=1 Tax=Sphaerochaeta globosa (strain ATCC BAA-1886 / DSM 22777 / Buddy) TaxID=158189 RepID=F0RXP9_SPHGB|nr:glycosyltransferase family 4 protein [Sphaerochaeta globosa]ADY12099.1 glycosyl transferase group 1 [Sphaerochaeta globosa str. Buddy]